MHIFPWQAQIASVAVANQIPIENPTHGINKPQQENFFLLNIKHQLQNTVQNDLHPWWLT